jgi:PAS domain S-box-containing protein
MVVAVEWMADQEMRQHGETESLREQRERETAPLEALQGALETLGFVIDALTEGIALVDRKRRVVYANVALRVLVATELESVLGRPFESLFPPASRARLRTLLSGWISVAGRTDVPLGHGEHEGAVLGVTGIPLQTPSFAGALVVVSDVSGSRLQQRQQAILTDVERGLVQSATLSESCRLLLRTLGEALNRPAGTVVLLDGQPEEGGVMYRWRAEVGRRGPFFGGERLPALTGLVHRVVASGQPAWASLADERDSPSAGLARGLVSAHAFPVIGDGQVLGAVELFGPQPPGTDHLLEAVMLPLTTALGAHVTLRRTLEQLRQVFEAAPIGICLLSRSGRVDRANPAFAAMVDRQPANGVGLELLELVDEPDRAAVGRLLAEIHGGRRDRFDVEVRGSRPLVRAGWLRLVVAAGGTGPAESLVLAAEDITERHLAAQGLEAAITARSAAIEQMRRMNEISTNAMSVVSHEFRTGLFGMQGYSEMLCRRDLPSPTVRDYAASINADAKRMGRLINDLLDLNRMEAGRERLQLAEVDLGGAVSEAVDRARATSDLHTFRVEIAADLPRIEADSDRLAQVLANLLGNAVKYSPGGGEVRVRAVPHTEGVLIEVADQGIGIPANLLEAVFEPFTRSKDHSAQAIKGTGLGLPIVQHVVRLHGGRVWAESREGGGAILRVVLPISAPTRSPDRVGALAR